MRLASVFIFAAVLFFLMAAIVYKQTNLRAVHWRRHSNSPSVTEQPSEPAVYVFTSPMSKGVWSQLPFATISLNALMSAMTAYRSSLQASEIGDFGATLRNKGFPWIAELVAINLDCVHLSSSTEEVSFAAECRRFGNLLQRQEDAAVFRALADYAEEADRNQLALLLAR